MSFAARLVPLLAAFAAPLGAAIVGPAHAANYEAGTVLVCDTQSEVEQFVTLFSGDPRAAIVAVNEAEHNLTACGLLDVTYLRGVEMGTVRNGDSAFQVVHILVVAIDNGAGMQSVRPTAFYSAFSVKEYGV